MSATTKSAPIYLLGTRQGNATYTFTGLPEFRSGLEACEYARANPMNGPVYVFEQRQLFKHGINYGSTLELVATAR